MCLKPEPTVAGFYAWSRTSGATQKSGGSATLIQCTLVTKFYEYMYITVLGSCFDKVPPLLFYGPLHGAGGLFAMQIPLRNPCHLHTNNLAVYKLEPTKNNLQTQNNHSLTPVLRSRSRWNRNYFGTWSRSRK